MVPLEIADAYGINRYDRKIDTHYTFNQDAVRYPVRVLFLTGWQKKMLKRVVKEV